MKQKNEVNFTGRAKKIVEIQNEINALQSRIRELKKEQIKLAEN